MGFTRARRATYPLDGHAISRLIGPFSESVESGQDVSPFTSDPIQEFFLEDEDNVGLSTSKPTSSSEFDGANSVRMDTIDELLQRCSTEVDGYKELLASHVDRAMEVFSRTEPKKSDRRLKVVLLLQDIGHNAALCKTNWDSDRRVTAGSHEFIDVVSSAGQRYIIELDLVGNFEIARPTRQYSRLVQSLPRVFVGKVDEMKIIVKAMTEAVKISLMSKGLTMPPWRNSCFMKNKWFGTYRRTIIPEMEVCSVNASVKCRSVGFYDTSDGTAVVHKR